MNLSLTRNIEKDKDTVPYFVRAELSTDVIYPSRTFHIPIRWQPDERVGNIIRGLYSVEICGFRLEAGNLNQIVRLVGRLLPGLINMARLPTYIFIARRSRLIYPVYTHDDEVFATTPGGPLFKHVELAVVRRNLSDYLHAVGELGAPGKSEGLHVRGVRRNSLALVRPVFYLKKRIPGENEFWAPVFPAHNGRAIYTYAASQRQEVEIADGREVLALRDKVARALIADNRLQHNFDLRPDRLMPDYWTRLQGTLKQERQKLAIFDRNGTIRGTDISLYKNGKLFIAVESRTDGNRVGLYVGQTPNDLKERFTQDYIRRGLISGSDAVRIVSARPKRRTSFMLDTSLERKESL